ncbi:uncharacterized protein I206_104856 [Kwoniella pini CBS 10737]|uniref:RNase III domain-containing protein n=1 Tax=Kwoniella pini CBS 10737 TaxID=1296096 RepID=A0AAJ8L655_9TREE
MRYQVSENGNNSLFSFVLPPLPKFPLPPLPNIKDQHLYRQVITHVSVQQLNRRSVMALAKPDDDHEKAVDYEKLEHVGDGLLESIASGLINDMYPWLRQGGAAIIRDHLVSNATLAQISVFYNLPQLINAREESLEYVRSSEKIQASVLEAWIAGVFYSYLSHGPGSHLFIDEEGVIEYQEGVPPNNEDLESTSQDDTTLNKDEELVEGIEEANFDDNAPKGLQPAIEPKIFTPQVDKSSFIDLTGSNKIGSVPKVSHITDLEDMISVMMTTAITTATSKTSLTSAVVKPLSGDAKSMEDSQQIHSESSSSAIQRSNSHTPAATIGSKISTQLKETTNHLTVTSSKSNMPAKRTKGQAYDYLISWLVPLLTPCCEWIYATLLEEQTKILIELPAGNVKLIIPEEWKDEDRKSVGMPQALSQHPWIRGSGSRPSYVKQPMPGQRWKVVCTAIDLDGEKWIGEGIRNTAQSAKNVAAWMVYRQLGQ